ncbi:hypothetical protein HPB52_017263 [Rhipicephalus sanguineus]|uniref:THAP-type domain-containing protein n=1 Tax=Rhipicephalus sanguineus TaxID=34632 RepID=A0A9D4PHK1_RHISA|nr:hypothetical protein HPB52_017263 [Rhipicephalus sanguineus]
MELARDTFSFETMTTDEEGVKCSVPTCDNVDVEGCGIVFHRFPISRPVILKKWLIQLQREDWTPTIEDRICNDHFDLRWFSEKNGEKVLRWQATPTIDVPGPRDCGEGVPQRSYLDRPKLSQELSDPDEPEATPCRSYVRKKKRPHESVQVTPDAKRPPSPIGLVMRKPIDSLQDIVNGLRDGGDSEDIGAAANEGAAGDQDLASWDALLDAGVVLDCDTFCTYVSADADAVTTEELTVTGVVNDDSDECVDDIPELVNPMFRRPRKRWMRQTRCAASSALTMTARTAST